MHGGTKEADIPFTDEWVSKLISQSICEMISPIITHKFLVFLVSKVPFLVIYDGSLLIQVVVTVTSDSGHSRQVRNI